MDDHGHSGQGGHGVHISKNGDYDDGDYKKIAWQLLIMMMQIGIMRSTSSSRSVVA